MVIQLISIHGLFQGSHLETGKDADNGGQIIYVMELAHALSQHPDVSMVYLTTRRIEDPALDPAYAEPIEKIHPGFEIRRVWCGGKKYLFKEQLWPHLDEFVSNTIHMIHNDKLSIDWIHSHYADAGYVAAELSAYLHIPFAHTAHSLGRPKLNKLVSSGFSDSETFTRFQFQNRFQAEESVLASSEFVVTSTHREISLFSEYSNHQLAEYHVIPPGIDFSRFHPYHDDLIDPTLKPMAEKKAMQNLNDRMSDFLKDPAKPLILAVCRPDRKKNIDGLIHAYGSDPELRAIANLAIFAGIRGDISELAHGAREVLTEILLLMDKYNLYGKIAIPKTHDSRLELPEMYRLCARLKGVFVNIALTEPFGLTILEATACGCPVVATNHGGPAEILPRCQNGFLVDPEDTEGIQKALRNILFNPDQWKQFSHNGISLVREVYGWGSHVDQYMSFVRANREASKGYGIKNINKIPTVQHRLKVAEHMLVSDIDGTLIHEKGQYDGLDELRQILDARGNNYIFGLATGRSLELTRSILQEFDIPSPDFVICSVGSYIYYGLEESLIDKGWEQFIAYQWNRDRISSLAQSAPGLVLQEDDKQNAFKISFYVNPEVFEMHLLEEALKPVRRRINVVYSRNAYVDILPRRCSKGRAVRYLSQKWAIPLKNTIVCGDTGNDLDMFCGSARGVIVNNYSPDLEILKGTKNNFFAPGISARGILQGLDHFQFLHQVHPTPMP